MTKLKKKEMELINDSCYSFINIYCRLNNITDHTEIDKVVERMFKDNISVFKGIKKYFFIDREIDKREYIKIVRYLFIKTFYKGGD